MFLPRSFVLAAGLVTASLVLPRGACSAPDPFAAARVNRPEFFPILPWDPYHGWGTPSVEHRKFGLESIADCHFNLAGFVLPRDLPLCQKLHLGAIMLPVEPAFTNLQYIYEWKHLSDAQIDQRVKGIVDAAGSNPAVVGYFITDEPSAADFPALGKAVAAVRKYAPGKLAYINLFPNYATLGAPDTSQLGASTYTEYLERFVAEVKPDLLSYDNYMVQYSMDLRNRGDAANYYSNLLEVRRVGPEHHLPFLNIVASCLLQAGKPVPSPANLRFQAFTTLAAGYKGVTWYTYFGDFYPNAPLDKSGEKTPIWPALQEVNRQVATLGRIMSRLTSTGVYFTRPLPADGLPELPGKWIASAECSSPVMIGEFEDPAGRRYAMVVNLSLEKDASFTLKTVRREKHVRLVSARDGSSKSIHSDAEIPLPPGGVVLFSLGK
jgi:hypothetical protein